jgi:hypothetical protein
MTHIKTFDDLREAISHEYYQETDRSLIRYQKLLSKLKEIETHIESIKKADRQFLIDLSLIDLSPRTLEYSKKLMPVAYLSAKTNFMFGRESGVAAVVESIRKHLEKNPI